MDYRVVRACRWSPDGLSLFDFAPGEVLAPRDPRVAGGFFEVAVKRGWVVPINSPLDRALKGPPLTREARPKPKPKPKKKGG